ncbi:hypothetical protein E4K67_18075 [Desulfosporosinus fructosivorans]|uniref:Bulb-type lectin domain-containing protein n=2 Tax=Desulfosporosinus fructosivorans TaxID=2018669 RepID=A0A4Z0R1Y3_9FIRM|nr:hypothetical protein E4K67_18075 [Desulfosporosinus fructosivorans]
MQDDGNLVLYAQGKTQALWASRTNGHKIDEAVLQSDGNFVIYAAGQALWASLTHGNQVAYLVVQNDGNLVIYHQNGTALWATNTVIQHPGALIAYSVGLREEGGASESSGPSIPTADFDHTFVQSIDGHKWGCWGRDDDIMKKEIANGGGRHRIKMAKCLAEPNGTAGIIWSKTGTCHQCANRILFPTRLTVSKARGYAGSVFLYGVYGRDYPVFMANVARCELSVNGVPNPLPIDLPDLPSLDDINPLMDEVESFTTPLNEEEKRYNQQLFNLYTHERDLKKALAGDLELLMQLRLDNRINLLQMNNLKNLQVDLQKDHLKLVSVMDESKITHKLFVPQMNELLERAMRHIEKIIGENNFLLAFDSPPDKASRIFTIPNLSDTGV